MGGGCCMRRIKYLGVIPARYASTRLSGKPLVDICGIPMIIHTFYRAKQSLLLDKIVVATDDEQIFELVQSHGGEAIMTSRDHQNGTERMYEVSKKIQADYYVLINGDEALLNPIHIDQAISHISQNPQIETLILYNKFYKRNSPSDFKIVLSESGRVLYISRSDIPSEYRGGVDFLYKAYHIMTFSQSSLNRYVKLKQTRCDRAESHELLRLIENDHDIYGLEVESSAISVDTSEDLEFVQKVMRDDELYKKYMYLKS